MNTRTLSRCLAAALLSFAVWAMPLAAQVKLTHESWPEHTFDAMRERVRENHDLNLLCFPRAKRVSAEAVNSPQFLTDGDVGMLGGRGRVIISGNPSRIVYYLGKPQRIQEILLYSGNVDSRSNQDFEIRLANNEKNPGTTPTFPEEATFSSGDKILGSNGGGFLSRFADKAGKALTGDEKYDWIEFRIWRSYPSKAGDPAKAASKASDWAAFLELQVLADPNDTELFATQEEHTQWRADLVAKRFVRELTQEVGEDVVAALENPESLKRAIEDLSQKHPDSYDGKKYLTSYESIVASLNNATQSTKAAQEQYKTLAKEFAALRREALLANPLLNFDKLLFRRAQNSGLTANWISNAARGKGRYNNALATVNPRNAQAEAATVIQDPNNSFVGDMNLHWDADKVLVTALSPQDKTWQVHELKLDGTGELKQITPNIGSDVDSVEGCYMPDGSTVFISTANMMGVPCIDGSSPVGNIYRLEKDGLTMRQLTFEQDQDWCPTLLPNGRVLYLRWEYIDTSHYFTRILFHMNPDGTNQVEYYGSNSFWPNSMFYAKPIPGSSTKFATIVTGHHGVSRIGELVLFDITKGRKEAEGVIQRIPGCGKKVEPIIEDQLVDDSWPKFLYPAPLDENYLIVSAQLSPQSPWNLYLVDTFDNMLLLRSEPGYGLYEPTPVIKRDKPPVRANQVDTTKKDSTVFVTDVYFGDGLKDVPKGTVKKFRVYSFHYGYRGIGSHDYFGMESCWDARRMLGEVPVYEDGSASFEMPANTPLALQPLDEQGRALQQMRTWFVGMPGENQFCIGCHESQNMGTPTRRTVAMGKEPTKIEPFLGPERPFSYKYEVQPVLDRYCVGCHNGEKPERPNFADTTPGYKGFSKSYHALHPYVRRPGPESDAHMLKPLEYHTSTSELFQMLEKGHYGVEVDKDSMRKLYAWADLNVPYYGTWIEIADRLNRPKVPDIAERASELRSLYAGIDFNPEVDPYAHLELPQNIEFVKPKEVQLDFTAPEVANWPFNAEKAKAMQSQSKTSAKQSVKVAEGVEFEMAWIPSGKFVMGDDGGFADELPRKEAVIEKPFWMMTTEVTNALYKEFDARHDSRYIDQWHKDHTTPGYPANLPNQPVIRVHWNRAQEFCNWLSEKTGKKFRLPTEAEWEWACRAGTATPMWYGNLDADFGKLENMADVQTKKFVVYGVNPKPINNPSDIQAFLPRVTEVDDGNMIAQDVGQYAANPWGLHDMHGSVCEWTASDYGDSTDRKVVRGGSWQDRPRWSRSGVRRAYEPWQAVFNVGFRVVCEE